MRMLGAKLLMAAAVLMTASRTSVAQQGTEQPVDPALPLYTQSEAVTGKVSVAGSMTMAQQASIWADSFKKNNPGTEFQLVAQGSVNAIPALLNGQADFALLSRPITAEEVKAFQDKFGYLPTVVVPALEQVAVYVHKDNPIESLTPSQLDAIFSKTLRRGAEKQAKTWGDVGVKGPLAGQPIVVQGRRDATGLQVYFQLAVLAGGEYRDDMVENQSSLDAIKAVATTPNAICFSGSTFQTPDVKAVPILLQEGVPAIGINQPGYPLIRPLQIILNHKQGTQLGTAQREFFKYIFSRQGQHDVIIGGHVPVTAVPAQAALEAVGLHTLN